MTITEFLEARIAEDEAVAKAIPSGSWDVGENPDYGFEEGIWDNSEPVNDIVVMRNYPEDGQDWPRGRHIARHDPARVLAECAAKRAVIKSYQSCQSAEASYDIRTETGVKLVASGMVKGMELAVKYLAAVYATHPDYQEAWPL